MKQYKTFEQWKQNGYYVIRSMKATWMYSEEYGREVAMFHDGQVLKNSPASRRRCHQGYYQEDWDDIEFEYGGQYYDDRPW